MKSTNITKKIEQMLDMENQQNKDGKDEKEKEITIEINE